MDEWKWSQLILKFKRSKLPDHAEALLELIEMLKEEQVQIKRKLGK